MPSITSWLRLEPRSRDAEMSTSLQARVYDPLWLLARQWQFGEFEGEDNGSPVIARWRGEATRLTRYQSGAIEPNTQITAPKYDGNHLPLETLVEREAVRPSAEQTAQPAKLRVAAEAGQHFLRLLDQQPLSPETLARYRGAFIREYAFQPLSDQQREDLDHDSLALLDLMTGRVPDGRRLAAAFHPTAGGEIVPAPALQIAASDLAEVKEAARLWLQWFDTFYSEPDASNPSWLPERMEYSFSVAARFADGERVLTAPEYYEGRLDWYAFDSNVEVKLGSAADNAFKQVMHTAIPAPASFRGMPAARFWEFEDAQVNFGAVDAGPTDMLRLLLVEFALSYGNDWFVIPVELEVGALYRTNSLVVTDSFGVRTALRPAAELPEPFSTWHMFEHSPLRGSGVSKPTPNLFFLPPTLVKSLESRPIEEVLFLRDEMANMSWGVERVIESASEQQLNRFEQQRNGTSSPPPQSAPVKTVYKLATETPDYWVPLVPVKRGTGLRLERAKLLKLDGKEEFVEARGRILNSGDTQRLDIFEEEIPREGIRVTRSYQLARWHDGSTHLWIGRRKRVGSGEGSSGLRFDSLFTR
ncbi:MAG TPA: hypothetical protein VGJ37_09570 [Pyrinomonadaceae bacterium]|jgi:hypothetical protein